MAKVKLNIFITEEQYAWLKEQAQERGLAVSDLIRRAIDLARAERERASREDRNQ